MPRRRWTTNGSAARRWSEHCIHPRSPNCRLYVQAAAGDAGGAIGAALVAWQRVGAGKPGGAGAARSPMTHASYGPAYTDAEIGTAFVARKEDIDTQGCVVLHISDES